jgi:hypothetical protein
MDLTPEEFAQVFGHPAGGGAAEAGRAPVQALIGSHLGGRQSDRVTAYARHLAADRRRIGLIEIDIDEFRLSCFDGHGHVVTGDHPAEAAQSDAIDVRRIQEALEELAWDVDLWLLSVPNPRTAPGAALLRGIGHWVLLATCDHDGVVSAYRTVKGLAQSDHPRLSLALLDAADLAQAQRVYRKLASVCGQFLQWPIDGDPVMVAPANEVTEHVVLSCRSSRSSGTEAERRHWQVVGDLLIRSEHATAARTPEQPAHHEDTRRQSKPMTQTTPSPGELEQLSHSPIPAEPESQARPASSMRMSAPSTGSTGDDEVIELQDDQADEAGILASILHHGAGRLIECPIRPPMCPRARLAVNRDRRLVLLGASRQGLGDLRAIAQAYQWLSQNRALVAMAVPQLTIDAGQAPHLSLYVDQRDTSAEILRPLLESRHVSVQTYRRLRWGGRTGLLLDAA